MDKFYSLEVQEDSVLRGWGGSTFLQVSQVLNQDLITCIRENSPHAVHGNINWYSHYGEQYGGSLKTKIRATLSSFKHESGENCNLKRYMHLNVYCSTVYNSQDVETT